MKEGELLQAWKRKGKFTGCAVDSRLVQPGNCFFALPGIRSDGHDYLSDVSQRGAKLAVVNENYRGEDYGLSLLRVKDPMCFLQALARAAVAASSARIVAITGSVGKTTTKTFLHAILKHRYRVMVTPGNQNSQIGMPLAIMNELKGDEEVIILEMGMSKKGELCRLVNIAPPDIALVTNIALVHAVNFASLAEIAEEKGTIFKHPNTAIGIFPSDCVESTRLATSGYCCKKEFCLDSEEGQRLLNDRRVPFSERHVCHNLLAALSIAACLGIAYEEAAEFFTQLHLPERRLTKKMRKGILFIDDSCNASEPSCKAALDALPAPEQPHSRKVAIFGEMRELGLFSETCHREVATHALHRVDALFCLGTGCKPMITAWKAAQRPVELYEDRQQLVQRLKAYLQPGDVVLVKGPYSMHIGNIIDEV